MRALQEELEYAARSQAKVLLTGESGVGKEVVACHIHAGSDRRRGPFVKINCAGVPDSLLESELFGHVRGSFTGAYRDRPGSLEAANGGTILLDEVGEMSPTMQAKLLRVLQEKKVRRVGGTEEVAVDVRVIASTNRDLSVEVAEGKFMQLWTFGASVPGPVIHVTQGDTVHFKLVNKGSMAHSMDLIVTGGSLMPSTQEPSHGAGHTRPVNSGKLLVLCKRASASFHNPL